MMTDEKRYAPDYRREFTGLELHEGEALQVMVRDYLESWTEWVNDRIARLRALPQRPRASSTEIDGLHAQQYQYAFTARSLARDVGMMRDDFYRGHRFKQYIPLSQSATALVFEAMREFRRAHGATRAAGLLGWNDRSLATLQLCLEREARVHTVVRTRLERLCHQVGYRHELDPKALLQAINHGQVPVVEELGRLGTLGTLLTPSVRAEAERIDSVTEALLQASTLRAARDVRAKQLRPPAHATECALLDVALRFAAQGAFSPEVLRTAIAGAAVQAQPNSAGPDLHR